MSLKQDESIKILESKNNIDNGELPKEILNSSNEKNEELTNSETALDLEKNEVEEPMFKRSYSLKKTTIKMLQELKVFVYDDVNTSYSDIVEEAIRTLYFIKSKRK